jgi:hypothetical protein
MIIKRAVYLIGFLLAASTAGAQINIYLGGNLQGNYSYIRGDEITFNPGFGGGLSFVYWEYEYWFIKAGLDYHYKSSTSIEYPDDFGIPDYGPDDLISVDIFEQTVGIPLTLYFRPYESKDNAILIIGSLEAQITAHLKASNEEYGDIVYKGNEVKTRLRTNVGIGVGYQRQLDRNTFLNIYPTFNVDIRAQRPFNSITLTAELLFGVY